MLFLLIGVLCSCPPFRLPSHITDHYCSTHLNLLFVTPDSLQYYINSWRSCLSLSHCFNLHFLHKIWFYFTFACPLHLQFNTFLPVFSSLQPKEKTQKSFLPRSYQLVLLSAHLCLLPQNQNFQLHTAEKTAYTSMYCFLPQYVTISSQMLPLPNYFFFRLMGFLKFVLTSATPCDAPSIVDFYVFTS